MRGTGSRTLVFLSVLALVMTGLIIGAKADVLNVAPANNIDDQPPLVPARRWAVPDRCDLRPERGAGGPRIQ